MNGKAYSSIRARHCSNNPEDQEFPLPADQLPDLPPIDLEQGPINNNFQLNPPNQPLDFPVEEVNQPNPSPRPTKPATRPSCRSAKSTTKPSCTATKSA